MFQSWTCTASCATNLEIRSTLSTSDKKDYISAVQCIQSKPSITPHKLAPGVRSRYDDFVATHINQTMTIHGTGNFLAWHRYFTWAYEKALRDECGYRGYQPQYWAWGKYAFDPLSSPIFDGSNTSMSGNGAYQKHTPIGVPSSINPDITIPPAAGGGCVDSGPFKDFVVNLGPVAAVMDDVPTNPQTDGLGYNPRCLRRDINEWVSSSFTKDSDTASLILENPDFYWFSTLMQGNFSAGIMGVHTGGHMTINGDPGGDLFVSPGDPAFYLHHSMIDRVWWIWQNQDIAKRTYAISGTITLDDLPPSRNTTLNDTMDLGVNAETMTLHDAMSTIAGPFCYIYV
ncbi:tyrosinase central domain-containing protein [Saccharata proteae CBS 121410]|uniref:Tyrosinase central domain-containing protein n=1 Tax=Saccharata proteae CBS 121410 TaxID=1314787 RepID=A0A9P4HVU1_9PEZI|nr:tyrosinase central domain-containing protein [Saccharata proteae CBS 121410]